MLRKTRDLLNLFSLYDFDGMMVSSVATSTMMNLEDFVSCIVLMTYYAHIGGNIVTMITEMLARYPNTLKEEVFGLVTREQFRIQDVIGSCFERKGARRDRSNDLRGRPGADHQDLQGEVFYLEITPPQ